MTMTHAMDDRMTALLASHYETVIEQVNETWWTATVSLVTASTRVLVATFGGFTRDAAQTAAYQFLKDRPR